MVLVSSSDTKLHSRLIGKYDVRCVERKPRAIPTKELIRIGTLTSPTDELLDLTGEEIQSALRFDDEHGCKRSDGNPSSLAIRHVRSRLKALMLIYLPAYRNESNQRMNYGLTNEEIVGFAISFPKDQEAVPVEYWVNPVYMEQDQ